MTANSKEFDVIIIGGGPAGLSTSLWCADLGLTSVVLESRTEFGGQLLNIHGAIKNYLGRETANGREMRDIFLSQVQAREIDLRTSVEISSIDFEGLSVTLSDGSVLIAKALVIATGVRRRRLNVPGEAEFYSRGILESGQRDKDLVKGKRVLIVGGGDAALENALVLAKTAKDIRIVHRGNKLRARAEFAEQLNANPQIKILFESVVTSFKGDDELTSAEIKNLRTGETDVLDIDAALIRIGVEPDTGLTRGMLEVDRQGYIVVNSLCETSFPNVFAVGDVANPVSPTISTAAGTGVMSAKMVLFLLNQKKRL